MRRATTQACSSPQPSRLRPHRYVLRTFWPLDAAFQERRREQSGQLGSATSKKPWASEVYRSATAHPLPRTKLPGMVSGVVGELRALYKQGDYEGVVSRVEQLQQRQRGMHDSADRPLLSAARAAALVHLGRTQLAAPVVKDLLAIDTDHPAYPAVSDFAKFAYCYIAWSSNQGVASALSSSRPDASRNTSVQALEAQLLYRTGRYSEAADIYRTLHILAKQKYNDAAKSQSPATSTWSLTGRRSASSSPLSPPANLAGLKQIENEIGTNLMAALVLAGFPSEALSLGVNLGKTYESEYNSGCAAISAGDWGGARGSLEEAERLYKALADSEADEDMVKALAPIVVQRAYVRHVAGEVAVAEKEYAMVVRDRKADPASLAVAANNAAVAKGQLALGKQQTKALRDASSGSISGLGSLPVDDDEKKLAEKDRNAILFDALKKMKATSGREVERKLTLQQRRAMARNRAILLVQMGRLDGCRSEVDKLKECFPDDTLVPLLEAALVAKRKSIADADALLKTSNVAETDVVRAARVQIAIEGGDSTSAVKFLGDLFPGRAAALATAVAILENEGNVDEAVAMLQGIQENYPGLAAEARKSLAGTLLKAKRYEGAATLLREILRGTPSDELARGQLVVATSYFDAAEAERLASQLQPVETEHSLVDAEALESRPPPRKRDFARATRLGENGTVRDGDDDSGLKSPESHVIHVEEKSKRKKKKKKVRLPKDYDPSGPPPDPERWLPKTLRSSYKKKKKNREANFRGAQGADAAAADAAGIRNAERSAARVAEATATASVPQMPKGTKGKKKNRRR